MLDRGGDDVRDNIAYPAVKAALLAAGAVLLLAAGAILWWFLAGDEPAAVDLGQAAAAAAPDPTAAEDQTPGGELPGENLAGGTDGTWSVDTSIGSVEEATGSFVGYRVQEELANIGASEAVGRTPAVTGTIEIERSTLTAAFVEADFTRLVSNDTRRDDRVQGALETDRFPAATFTLTEPVDFGAVPSAGQTLSVTAAGDLTVHGVTNRVEIPLQAQLVDDVIVVVGSFDLVFADYGVEPPSAVIVLSVEDHGTVELQLFFTRA